MASHSPYPHPGPGPSSYYQPSPPPHQGYGNHSPVPRPNYYPYPPPAPQPQPPPMNSHPSSHGQYQQHPGSSRGSHRGGHVNGAYSSRGAHHYPHHNYPQQQPSYAHPTLGIHPHAGQPIPNPYSPQSAKYNPQAYSPSYHYPSPTAPVFTPSWQTQQPISPLPKQLSMPPPPNIQAFYEPSQSNETPMPQSPVPVQPTTERPMSEAPSTPPTPISAEAEALDPSIETATSSKEPSAPSSPIQTPSSPIQTSSSYSQMGTIQTSDPPSQPTSPTTARITHPIAQWAIWSRRPQDPSQAPGIIISSRARPPPDVVHLALDMKTPPPSRPATPGPPSIVSDVSDVEEKEVPSSPAPPSRHASDETAASNLWSSQSNSTVPSSSVTESTDTPTIPGSPASSHTSVSATGLLAKEKEVSNEADEAAAVPAVSASVAPDTSSTPMPPDEPAVSSAEVTESSSSTSDIASAAATLPPATVPTAAAAAPAPKKSWASLLRPASSASPAQGGSSRNALPTSSVVGFSIPANTLENPSMPVSPSKKSELVALLTSGPASGATGFAAAAAGATSATSGSSLKIRPRGLVNSGNMCFANSVLQILVYCPPFHRLFIELGKLLVGPVVGGNNKDDAANKLTANGSTPLVDATAAFLQEFVEEKKKKSGKVEVIVTRNGLNGSSGSGGRGKGKEKEVKEDYLQEEDWDGDSFLPSYVYDAMKAKKRFDNMRGGHQEDAEEFFGFYLDTLEEELLSLLNSVNPPKPINKPVPAVEEKEEAAPPEDDGWLEVGKRNRTVVTRTTKATESPITRIFGGKFRSTLRAPGQKDSVVVEDWRSLRLDIQREQIHTVQDALSYISYPQPVQVTQAAKPGITIEAQQQVLIEALPPILVLHLKRFCYDTTVNGVVKVGKHVRFGPELDIGPDVMIPAAKKSQPARYKLFGAVYHHGLSASGGHYTLDVLHPNRYPSMNPSAKPREGWVRIDDELVSDVRPDDVFNAPERDDSRCAYLLFYRRI